MTWQICSLGTSVSMWCHLGSDAVHIPSHPLPALGAVHVCSPSQISMTSPGLHTSLLLSSAGPAEP